MAKKFKKPYEKYDDVLNILKSGFDLILSSKKEMDALNIPAETQSKILASLQFLQGGISDISGLQKLEEAEWKELLSKFKIVG